MRGKFSRIYLTDARIIRISVRLFIHPCGRHIEMLVGRIDKFFVLLKIFERPCPCALMARRIHVGADRADDFDLRIFFPHARGKDFKTGVEMAFFGLPLLVAQPDIFKPERLGMSHFSAHSAPYRVSSAVCKLHDVERILNIGLELGIVGGYRLFRHILAGNPQTDDRQRLCAQVFTEKKILIPADAERLTIVRKRRNKIPLRPRAVHRPTVPVVPSAFGLSHGKLPAITVGKRIPLNDATSGEAHKPGMQTFQQFGNVTAENAIDGILRHERKAVNMHRARLVENKAELCAFTRYLCLDTVRIFMPLSVGMRLTTHLEHGFRTHVNSRHRAALVIVRANPEREPQYISLLQKNPVVRPV